MQPYRIQCPCGGIATKTGKDGVWYWLTEDYRIIFIGICGTCKKRFHTESDIAALLLLCPNGKEKPN